MGCGWTDSRLAQKQQNHWVAGGQGSGYPAGWPSVHPYLVMRETSRKSATLPSGLVQEVARRYKGHKVFYGSNNRSGRYFSEVGPVLLRQRRQF